MAKTYTKETLAESLGMSPGLLVMEAKLAGLAEEYDKLDGKVKRVFTTANRQAIIDRRTKVGLKTPLEK